MQKIPTLYQRDPEDMKHVLPTPTPGCEWVLAGEGLATRKYDGICVLIRCDGQEAHAFTRRIVKPGKQPPPGFEKVEHDPATGKTVGWEPAEQSGFNKYIREVLDSMWGHPGNGTYELCGPKIQGNPEGFDRHVLIAHACAMEPTNDWTVPPPFEDLGAALRTLGWEGIVWHHPDGRMAKLKRRDFPKADR